MLKLDANPAELKEVIARVADYTLGMDLTWDWPCGVAYYGVCRAFEATGERRIWNEWRRGATNMPRSACRRGRSIRARWGICC